jgi:hypothetical protein
MGNALIINTRSHPSRISRTNSNLGIKDSSRGRANNMVANTSKDSTTDSRGSIKIRVANTRRVICTETRITRVDIASSNLITIISKITEVARATSRATPTSITIILTDNNKEDKASVTTTVYLWATKRM